VRRTFHRRETERELIAGLIASDITTPSSKIKPRPVTRDAPPESAPGLLR
jgi:hypothetical protein